MKKISIILFSILFWVACQNVEYNEHKTNNNNSLVKVDTLFREKIKTAPSFSTLFEVNKTIELETTEESLIGNISQLEYLPKEGKIIVLDSFISKGIFVFDLEGKFLFRIGMLGDGPKEFIQPICIAYRNNKVVVNGYDLKLLYYDLEGAFIDEISLKNKALNFAIQKMVFLDKSIYCYTNHPTLNVGLNDKKNRVFEISYNGELKNSYGSVEDNFNLYGGDLVLFNNKILFSGIFDGNIYEINESKNEAVEFSSIGQLTDINKIESSQNKLQYMMENMTRMDFILQMGVIKNHLFVQRSKAITVIDHNGVIIRKNLKDDAFPPKPFRGISMQNKFTLIEDGYIMASINQSKSDDEYLSNPTLIFYSAKNK